MFLDAVYIAINCQESVNGIGEVRNICYRNGDSCRLPRTVAISASLGVRGASVFIIIAVTSIASAKTPLHPDGVAIAHPMAGLLMQESAIMSKVEEITGYAYSARNLTV